MGGAFMTKLAGLMAMNVIIININQNLKIIINRCNKTPPGLKPVKNWPIKCKMTKQLSQVKKKRTTRLDGWPPKLPLGQKQLQKKKKKHSRQFYKSYLKTNQICGLTSNLILLQTKLPIQHLKTVI